MGAGSEGLGSGEGGKGGTDLGRGFGSLGELGEGVSVVEGGLECETHLWTGTGS